MAALKPHDSPVAVLYAARLATWLLPAGRRSRVSPTQVSVASLVATLVAAVLVAGGSTGATAFVAALLVQAGFVLDCLDGQLARTTGRESHIGAYVDAMSDLGKVFVLLAACGFRAGGDGILLAGVAFFFFALCQHHVHVTKTFPQRSQTAYEESAVPWKRRLVVNGQTMDLAFAIGEVLLVVSLAIATGWYPAMLWLLVGILPIQFVSYSVRFWRHRYDPAGPA